MCLHCQRASKIFRAVAILAVIAALTALIAFSNWQAGLLSLAGYADVVLPIRESTTWTDSNWAAGNYDEAVGVDWHDGDKALILGFDMVLHGSILDMGEKSQIQRVYGMQVYNDVLYMVGSRSPLRSAYGDVVAYDGNNYTHSYCLSAQEGALRINLLTDKHDKEYLVVPGLEQEYAPGNCYGDPDCYVREYVFDGAGWDEKIVKSHYDTHGWDIVNYNDRVYVSNALYKHSDVYSTSGDFLGHPRPESIEWRYEFGSDPSDLFQRLIVFEGNLYITTALTGKLYRFDGSTRTTVSGDFTGRMWSAAVFDGWLYIGDENSIHRTNGNDVSRVADTGLTVWDLEEHDGSLYAAVSDVGSSFLGDGENNAQLWILNGDSLQKIWEGEEDSALGLASYEGRLWLGTGREGNIYVSGHEEAGHLISSSHDMGAAMNYGGISWSSDGDSIRLQIRTSDREEGLPGKDFLGPDGTASTYYAESGAEIYCGHDGDQWIQFKAYLSTVDASSSPLLHSVTIAGNDMRDDEGREGDCSRPGDGY
jgi:hypothetical protein